MKKIIIIFLALIYASLTTFSKSLSVDDALRGAKQLFASKSVAYYLLEDGDDDYWTIFIDAHPNQLWGHECYTYKIPRTSNEGEDLSNPSIQQYNMPLKGEYQLLSLSHQLPTFTSSPINIPKKTNFTEEEKYAAEHTYAILLIGSDKPNFNYKAMWNDCSFLYTTLTRRYGIEKSHIFPLVTDGNDPAPDIAIAYGDTINKSLDLDYDGINEIELSATKDNLGIVLDKLLPLMNEGDHLLFFIEQHGDSNRDDESHTIMWDGENLYDRELAAYLKPFIEKSILVNIAIEACYSGGFIDDFNQKGVVITTATDVSTYALSSGDGHTKGLQYGEFAYPWICALNGTDLDGNIVTNCDLNDDGIISMSEAFQYVLLKDTKDNPQYCSNTELLGEQLSLSSLPFQSSLYIKHDENDAGKRINYAEHYWNSPSIWTRYKDDNIEKDEHPVFKIDNGQITAYVRVNYNGWDEMDREDHYLHLYWASPSTFFSEDTFKNTKDDAFGGYVGSIKVPYMSDGESSILKYDITLSDSVISKMLDSGYNGRVSLFARISKNADETLTPQEPFYNPKTERSQAIKSNVYLHGFSNDMRISIRKANIDSKGMSLSLTDSSKKLLSYFYVTFEMDETLYNAWLRGGSVHSGMVNAYDEDDNIVEKAFRLTTAGGELSNIILNPNEVGIITLHFDSWTYVPHGKKFDVSLIQKEDNVIIAGYDMTVSYLKSAEIIPIDSLGMVTLTIDGAEDMTDFKWYDSNSNLISTNEQIQVLPTLNNNMFSVVASDSEYGVIGGEILLPTINGIDNINICNNHLLVSFQSPAQAGSQLLIRRLDDGSVEHTITIVERESVTTIDISDLTFGLHILEYKINDTLIQTIKFNKQ